MKIYVLGTSVSNCKKGNGKFIQTLAEELDNITVINGCVNGSDAENMLVKIKLDLYFYKHLDLVIFEPGPLDSNWKDRQKDRERVIEYLVEKNIQVIYVSHGRVEKDRILCEQWCKQQGILYYGYAWDYIPRDPVHKHCSGYMSEQGCEAWAKQMADFIRQNCLYES